MAEQYLRRARFVRPRPGRGAPRLRGRAASRPRRRRDSSKKEPRPAHPGSGPRPAQVVVNNIEASLLRIQRLETKIEERIGLTRSQSIDKLHALATERSRRSFDRDGNEPTSPKSPFR